jgi:hypothetical protein
MAPIHLIRIKKLGLAKAATSEFSEVLRIFGEFEGNEHTNARIKLSLLR